MMKTAKTEACEIALSVAGVWNAPLGVREYLRNGNEELRENARNIIRNGWGNSAKNKKMASARLIAWLSTFRHPDLDRIKKIMLTLQ